MSSIHCAIRARYAVLTALFIHLVLFSATGCQTLNAGGSADVYVDDDTTQVQISFSTRDREHIYNYYRARAQHMPPGLAKKGKVPPGHRKRLERKGTLPPGIAYKTLPGELERTLSRLPRGYIRIKVGTQVMILNQETDVIVDVLHDIGS